MCFAGGQTEKQNIKNLMIFKDRSVSLFLWCYHAFHEVKHVENLREHVKGMMDKLREHVEGVMDKNGHCAGSIIT